VRLLHLDPFGGASGDMILGALIDVSADADATTRALEAELDALMPFGVRLVRERLVRHGIAGTRITVEVSEEKAPHRRLADVLAILSNGSLDPGVRAGAEKTFRALAQAEADVHGTSAEDVHFHEIGAGDSLVDVTGAHVLVRGMGVERVTCGAVPAGSGTVETAHGTLPVPAPATVKLLEGLSVSGLSVEGEAVTPTGAALLRTLTTGPRRPHHEADPTCGPRGDSIPPMTVTGSGFGFGAREGAVLPNALRVILGESCESGGGAPSDGRLETVTVLETTVDDMPGEWAGDLFELLTAAGALEVSTTPVGMKKSRPGVRLTIVARPADAPRLAEILVRESTTFGVRMRSEERLALSRRTCAVVTPWGEVGVKIGMLRGEIVQVSPEYEDCRRVAREAGVALKRVYEAAAAAFRSSEDRSP
jgi:uncharacterized protein (TIGR00299 family) protein